MPVINRTRGQWQRAWWGWRSPVLVVGQTGDVVLQVENVPAFGAVLPSRAAVAQRVPPSWRRDAYFAPTTTPVVVPPATTFYSSVVPTRAAWSARASSSRRVVAATPILPPSIPTNVPSFAVLPSKAFVARRTSHRIAASFRPTMVIADAAVTPVGPSGPVLVIDAEAGSTVTFSWVTDVMKSWDGLEQRQSVLAAPRRRHSFSANIEDARQRSLLSLYAGNAPSAPSFLLGVSYEDARVESSAGTAITLAAGAIARADWARVKQRIVVVHPNGSTILDGWITNIADPVITTNVDLSAAAVAGARMMPALASYLDGTQGIGRYTVGGGQMQLSAMSALFGWAGVVPAMGANAVVNTYESVPVWDWGVGKSEGATSQPMYSGVLTRDLGGLVTSFSTATVADWGRGVMIRGGRDDWQWFKAFLSTVRGRHQRWLLPTGRPDLVPIGDASTGTLTVEGPPVVNAPDYVNSWFPSLAHRRLRIVKTDGSFVYRTVNSCASFAGSQQLVLDSATAGAIARVEFLELVRLDSDDVSVTFDGNVFTSPISARVIQQ